MKSYDVVGLGYACIDYLGTVPHIPENNTKLDLGGLTIQGGGPVATALVALARRDHLTVRQLARMVGGYGGLQMVGTPAQVADTMQEWLETEACDGFNVMFPTVPAGLDDFVDLVIPELQRRGIFRKHYEGTTLREHLGLQRPPNRFFPTL